MQGAVKERELLVEECARSAEKCDCRAWIVPGVAISFSIAVLTAIAIPCYIGAQAKMATAKVRGNMRTIQVAAESAHSGCGRYPLTQQELTPYLPGGSATPGGKSGVWPTNPYTQKEVACEVKQDFLKAGPLERNAFPDFITGAEPGQIIYFPMENGRSYYVAGTDDSREPITGITGRALLLSNQ